MGLSRVEKVHVLDGVGATERDLAEARWEAMSTFISSRRGLGMETRAHGEGPGLVRTGTVGWNRRTPSLQAHPGESCSVCRGLAAFPGGSSWGCTGAEMLMAMGSPGCARKGSSVVFREDQTSHSKTQEDIKEGQQ